MNTDKIVALNIGRKNNNWQMHYNGFMLSVHIDNEQPKAGSVAGGRNNAPAYTLMDVRVFDAKDNDYTEEFFGPAVVDSGEQGIWAVSSFTEFLELANKFKTRVDEIVAQEINFYGKPLTQREMEDDAALDAALNAGLEILK